MVTSNKICQPCIRSNMKARTLCTCSHTLYLLPILGPSKELLLCQEKDPGGTWWCFPHPGVGRRV